MSKFMLILHDNPSAFRDYSAEDMQRVVERYGAWAQSIGERGASAGGNKLTDDGGRWLTKNGNEISCVDGPYAEAKEVIGGYFLINADSLAEAEALARECPHLDYQGRIELREVDDIPGDHE